MRNLALFEKEGSFNVFLHDFRARMLLIVSNKELIQASETKDANTSCCKARLTDPNIVRAVNLAVLRIASIL